MNMNNELSNNADNSLKTIIKTALFIISCSFIHLVTNK